MKKYNTVKETAEILGMNPSNVGYLIKKNRLRAVATTHGLNVKYVISKNAIADYKKNVEESYTHTRKDK